MIHVIIIVTYPITIRSIFLNFSLLRSGFYYQYPSLLDCIMLIDGEE